MPDKPIFKLAPAPGTPGAPKSELTAEDRNYIKSFNESIRTFKKTEEVNEGISAANRESEAGPILCGLFGLPAAWADRMNPNHPRFIQRCKTVRRFLNIQEPVGLYELLDACQVHLAQGGKLAMLVSTEKITAAPIADVPKPEATPAKRKRTSRTPHENPESLLKGKTQVPKRIAGEVLGLSDRGIYNLVEAGELVRQNKGRCVMITVASIRARIKGSKKSK